MDAADNAVAAAWIRLKLCAKWVAQHTSRTSLHRAGTAATRDHHTSSMHSRHVRFLQEKKIPENYRVFFVYCPVARTQQMLLDTVKYRKRFYPIFLPGNYPKVPLFNGTR